MLQNTVSMARATWMRRLFGDERIQDIDKECGHPLLITIEEYLRLFRRGDIAQRVVNLYPGEAWGDDPEVYENENEEDTEFEKAWQDLDDNLSIFSFLHRVDVLSGVGRFGVLLLGFGDGIALNLPVADVPIDGTLPKTKSATVTALNYLRAFDESCVKVKTLEPDVKSPRYGKPVLYSISFGNQTSGAYAVEDGQKSENLVDVHWSRVIHVADNRTISEIYGSPRMEVVFNRLLDLRKIAGGSAEMFWKGGFPGMSLEAMPMVPGEEIEFDKAATEKQMDEYSQGLSRYIALVGMQAKVLAPNIADPTPSMTVQLKLIATAMGCPWRILIGSEAAQLASEQDTRAWNRRIQRRRTSYLNPFVLRPFINRLMAAGTLPLVAQYIIDWPGLNESEGLEKAQIALAQSQAMAQYVQSGASDMMPPFQYFTLVLGYSDAEAQAVVDAAVTQISDEDKSGLGGPEDGDSNAPEDGDSNT